MKRIIAGALLGTLIFNLSGCAGAGYEIAPSSKKEVLQETTIQYDKFKKQTSISTPPYLIRDGFTDKFPVIVSYKSIVKNNKLQFVKMDLKILGTERAFFNQAVGEDGYEFKFEEINPYEEGTTITTRNGQYSSTTTVKKEVFSLFFTLEELKKMTSQDYAIKVYGKTREGDFTMPKFISSAFYQKLQSTNK